MSMAWLIAAFVAGLLALPAFCVLVGIVSLVRSARRGEFPFHGIL